MHPNSFKPETVKTYGVIPYWPGSFIGLRRMALKASLALVVSLAFHRGLAFINGKAIKDERM